MTLDPQWIGSTLLEWYRANARDLPWRSSNDPYAIWVSEIMLQQTRVEAVIPYFERFLARFPNVDALAAAPEEELLSAWSGLGYYTRARNLQKAAQIIARRGVFPRTFAEIMALPGIGDYTAAAVASIAFGLPHAVLDGNVIRVMARLTADFGDVSSQSTKRRLRETAQRCLPSDTPGDFNQALMELGATVCTPRDPKCLLCPVSRQCKGRQEGVQDELPTKIRRAETIPVELSLMLIEAGDQLLLWKRPPGDRMAGFWELPTPDMLPLAVPLGGSHQFRHSIMNRAYRCTVNLATVDLPAGESPAEPLRWMPRGDLESAPLSTIARKALRMKRNGAG